MCVASVYEVAAGTTPDLELSRSCQTLTGQAWLDSSRETQAGRGLGQEAKHEGSGNLVELMREAIRTALRCAVWRNAAKRRNQKRKDQARSVVPGNVEDLAQQERQDGDCVCLVHGPT